MDVWVPLFEERPVWESYAKGEIKRMKPHKDTLYYEDTPPSSYLIQAMIDAEAMSLRKAVAELIANALDQDATRIDLSFDRENKALTCKDDGNGCPRLQKMIQQGSHLPGKSSAVIGRFGVGFKDAVIWLGNRVTVDSQTREGKKLYAVADWKQMMADGSWPTGYRDNSDRDSHGITVRVSELRTRRLKAWDQMPTYVAELFSAAIDAGVVITVDAGVVKSIPQPLITDSVDFQLEHDGLRGQGTCGILVNSKAMPSGWEIRYGHQTIALGYQKEGFGTFSPQGFYGRFYMLDGERRWTLSRNKTDSEDLADVLGCDQLQHIIAPILQKLRERAVSMAIRNNQLCAQTFLTNLLQRAKVKIAEEGQEGREHKRRKPNPNPQPEPDNKPREERKRYEPDDLSDTKKKIKLAQTINVWPHQNTSDYGFGYVTITEHGTVMKVFIDNSSNAGQSIWRDTTLLIHHATMVLAVYFGTKLDIASQLRLPIGHAASEDIKISKAFLYLLGNVDWDEFKTSMAAA